MINAAVLVLNQNYEPLNVCDIRRAFVLLGSEKAEPTGIQQHNFGLETIFEHRMQISQRIDKRAAG